MKVLFQKYVGPDSYVQGLWWLGYLGAQDRNHRHACTLHVMVGSGSEYSYDGFWISTCASVLQYLLYRTTEISEARPIHICRRPARSPVRKIPTNPRKRACVQDILC